MSFISTITGAVVGGLAGYGVAQIVKSLTGQVSQSTGNLRFPANLNDKYHMTIQFFQYSRQTPLEVGNAVPLGSVNLPIPNNLADTQSINFAEEDLGPALGGAAGAIFGGDYGPSGVAATAGNAIGAAAVAGLAGAVSSAAPGVAALGSAKLGVTANPFLTVLFKNPNYRVYDFTWRLFPRNQAESAVLQGIYNSVKYHMVPAASPNFGGAILTYPSLVKVTLTAGGRPLMPFKYGVIDNATFNFAPDGAPSFHRNGEPTAVDFRISIKEVEYFLKNSPQKMFSS